MARAVGYGVIGSYSHQAFLAFGLNGTDYEDARSFPDAAALLADGTADYLVLPLRNTTVGPVNAALQALEPYAFDCVRELDLIIENALFGGANADLSTVRTVTSYPVALQQCQIFITQHGWQQRDHTDTAGAIADVMAQNDPTLAAIGPLGVGQAMGARLLAHPVNDRADNITTFGLFQRSL